MEFNEFNNWVKKQESNLLSEYAFFDENYIMDGDYVEFYEANSTIKELKISTCVLVDGNLTIENGIIPKFESGLLVVNGDLHCKKFNFPYQTVISGNLYAETIDVDSSCDYYIAVGGDIICETIIERGHSIEVSGEIKANKVYSFNNVKDKNQTYPRTDYDEFPKNSIE